MMTECFTGELQFEACGCGYKTFKLQPGRRVNHEDGQVAYWEI